MSVVNRSSSSPVQKHNTVPDSVSLPCFCCGICCVRFQVRLSLAEAQSIADELGITRGEFISKYADPRWPGTDSFLLRQDDGACVFLAPETGSKQRHCRIHSFRSLACRDWTPSLYRRECQEGLARYWGLAVSPRGKLRGPGGKIRSWQQFLKALETDDMMNTPAKNCRKTVN